jgi:hypothetical protein
MVDLGNMYEVALNRLMIKYNKKKYIWEFISSSVNGAPNRVPNVRTPP